MGFSKPKLSEDGREVTVAEATEVTTPSSVLTEVFEGDADEDNGGCPLEEEEAPETEVVDAVVEAIGVEQAKEENVDAA